MKKHLLTLCCLLLLYCATAQECAFPDGVAIPEVNCDEGTPLTDNVNITQNSVYHFNGTNGNFSNITLSGGTLVLCGSATLSDVNHNGGTLLIKSGSNITFAGNFNVGGSSGGSHRLFNMGTVSYPANVQVQGGNQFVYNAIGAILTVHNGTAFLNSGDVINYGTIITDGIVANSSNVSLCFGNGAVVVTTTIVSNGSGNAITVPSGNACLNYTEQFTGNAPIANTPSLKVCQDPEASDPENGVIGNATLVSDCSSCSAVLPVTLSSFSVNENNGTISVSWVTAAEENAAVFIVEKSVDGRNFTPIGQIPARNVPSTYQYGTESMGKSYFRLRIVDKDGRAVYSRVLFLQISAGHEWKLLSNPVFSSHLQISMPVPTGQQGELIITDNLGRLVRKRSLQLLKGNNVISLPIERIAAGNYYLRLKTASESVYKVIPFIVGVY